ncbi:hypothetical protein [Flavobacterium anhuiense]|uniref:hypothetical protein n=1 Tax=Flavobacterium anhuiense TaxID=459526 RepID=UPI00202755C3|nr:hypothetical protein [Flavobacterium anhuiense]URM36677.1 hypothetical protein LLY39_20100 [Flavobacterium anhuiense]
MAANCSFFNSVISGISASGSAFESIMTGWYVFNSDIIYYNNHKLVVLGLSLIAFLSLLVYQFFKIKAKIGYFIEKRKSRKP